MLFARRTAAAVAGAMLVWLPLSTPSEAQTQSRWAYDPVASGAGVSLADTAFAVYCRSLGEHTDRRVEYWPADIGALALAQYRADGEERLEGAVPGGFLYLTIDDNPPFEMEFVYDTSYPTVFSGDVTADLLDQLREGSTLALFSDAQLNELVDSFPLSGSSAAIGQLLSACAAD